MAYLSFFLTRPYALAVKFSLPGLAFFQIRNFLQKSSGLSRRTLGCCFFMTGDLSSRCRYCFRLPHTAFPLVSLLAHSRKGKDFSVLILISVLPHSQLRQVQLPEIGR